MRSLQLTDTAAADVRGSRCGAETRTKEKRERGSFHVAFKISFGKILMGYNGEDCPWKAAVLEREERI